MIGVVRRSSDPENRRTRPLEARRASDPLRRSLVNDVLNDLRDVRDEVLVETALALSIVATPGQSESLIALLRELSTSPSKNGCSRLGSIP